jgi:hypothetical protein
LHHATLSFFLFGYPKEQLKYIAVSDEKALSVAIRGLMGVIPGDLLWSVFSQWMKRFRDYIDANSD